MSSSPLRVLTISDLYPRPRYPVLGIFVEQQTVHLQTHCEPVVVAPTRMFPPLRLFKTLPSLRKFRAAWQQWRTDSDIIPAFDTVKGVPVYYPRYTSVPKQVYQGSWGAFAYMASRSLLSKLHDRYHFDLIHAHYASPAGLMAILAKRWLHLPVVLSVHGSDITYTARQRPFGNWTVQRIFDEVDVIIANSQWTSNQIQKYGGDPQKIRIVYYGGDAPIRVPPAVSATKNKLNLLTVAYLEERKGIHLVLQAVKQLRDEGFDLTYTIVGDGSYRATLEQLTEELGLTPYVHFAGYTPHDQVWPYFAACDLFALPSWREAFGIVYLEALGQGKPVVGCDTSGAFDVQQQFPDGVELVQEQDVPGVVNALRTLMVDEARRERVRERGPQLIEERFTWARNAEETIKIYRDVIKAHQWRTSESVPATAWPERG